jgi:hypothetical protein
MSGCMYGLKNEVGGQYEGNLGPKNIYLWSLKATTTSNMTDNGSITDLQMLNVIWNVPVRNGVNCIVIIFEPMVSTYYT